MLLGIDVGTTCVKAAIFSPDGDMKSEASDEYGIDQPHPGWAEQDGERVFSLMCEVIRRAAMQHGRAVKALSLSVQGDAVTAVDAHMRPLLPFQLGMDYRCNQQAEAYAEEFGALPLFQKTGMRPHPINTLCKIRWITENRPDVACSAARYMTYSDFLLCRLGVCEPVIDLAMASRTMALPLTSRSWDGELLRAARISPEQLSRPVPSGTAVGELQGELAKELGLPRGVLLVTGGHDQALAALGAGLSAPGLALDSHGTAEVISTVLGSPQTESGMFEGFFPCYAHAVPDRYLTFSLNHTAGILLKWYTEGFCAADEASARLANESLYGYVLSKAADGPSSVLVLPYFAGKGTPDCDLNAKGLIAGLTLSTSRHAIARGIIEALAFDMRENLEALADTGIPVAELRCVGGGARSPIGLQIKADVTGLPVHTLRVREAACFGAAMLAGVAVNCWSGLDEAASLVRLDRTYTPNPNTHDSYAKRYEAYRALYRVNRELLAQL